MVIAIKTTALLGADRSPDLMTSIPPTERICEAISEFLTKGISDSGDVTNTLFLLGAQRLIQELLEQEATDSTLAGNAMSAVMKKRAYVKATKSGS